MVNRREKKVYKPAGMWYRKPESKKSLRLELTDMRDQTRMLVLAALFAVVTAAIGAMKPKDEPR